MNKSPNWCPSCKKDTEWLIVPSQPSLVQCKEYGYLKKFPSLKVKGPKLKKSSVKRETETVIVTTTNNVPGRKITKILGIVHDARTARVSGKKAQEKIIKEMIKQAKRLGADAIVSVKIDIAPFGGYSGTGTAVKLN